MTHTCPLQRTDRWNFEFMKIQDLQSIPHASTPTSIIPTKFEVDITIHCRVIAFLSAHTSRDLDLWPFVLEQLTYMAGNVTNLVTKFEHPMPIPSWFMSYNVSLWLLHWECVRGHCACAESRDPWVGGLKQLHFWNSRPIFAYSYTTSLGLRRRLRVVYSRASPMLKPLIA